MELLYRQGSRFLWGVEDRKYPIFLESHSKDLTPILYLFHLTRKPCSDFLLRSSRTRQALASSSSFNIFLLHAVLASRKLR
jgi:hypothetical protein